MYTLNIIENQVTELNSKKPIGKRKICGIFSSIFLLKKKICNKTSCNCAIK